MPETGPAGDSSPRQAFLPGRQALLVRLIASDGKRAGLLDALNTYTDTIAQEPGTEVFLISIDADDSNLVWLYEVFRDEEAEIEHRKSAGFLQLMESMPEFVEVSPGILRMQPIRMSVQDTVFADDWSFS